MINKNALEVSNFRKEFKFIFMILKVVGLYHDDLFDLFKTIPFQILCFYAFYVIIRYPTLGHEVMPLMTVLVAEIMDFMYTYYYFIEYLTFMFYNFIVNSNLKNLFSYLDKLSSHYFYSQIKYRKIWKDLVFFVFVYLFNIGTDYYLFNNNDFWYILKYFGYTMGLIINFFYSLVIYEVLFLVKQMFGQINQFILVHEKKIFGSNSLEELSKFHLDLVLLSNNFNSIFSYQILGLISSIFISCVLFTFKGASILNSVFHRDKVDIFVFLFNALTPVILFVCMLFLVFVCWASLDSEVSEFNFSCRYTYSIYVESGRMIYLQSGKNSNVI